LTLALTFFGDFIDVRIIFPVFAAVAFFAVISVKKIPPVKGHAHGKKKLSYREFFKDKVCVTLLALLFAMQFSYGCYANFMQNFLEKELGMAPWVWGLTVFCTISGELVFFVKCDYFFKRFTLRSIMIFSVFVQALRCLSFAFFAYAPAIVATSLLTGSFGAVMVYSAACYVNLTAKKEMRAFGQTLMYAVSFYIPRFLAGMLGGFTVEFLGFSSLMAICAAINIALFAFSKFMPLKSPSLSSGQNNIQGQNL
jgi:predicted MFS family arabinose efflux permease